MRNKNIAKKLQERFGDPIGSYAGDAPIGVRSVEEDGDVSVCPGCGMMVIDGDCGCEFDDGLCDCGMPPSQCVCGMSEGVEPCDECGMMPLEGDGCGCTHMAEAEKKGPTKKAAQKILRGTKTFKEKMKKVAGWADDPAAAAAWMTKKATGKWPSQK